MTAEEVPEIYSRTIQMYDTYKANCGRLCLETSIAICAMLYQYLLYFRFFPILSWVFSAVLSSFTSFAL